MKVIKTIDLWTEQHDNHEECFRGAFIDGFENERLPFDEYKIIKNCNCMITVDDQNINIHNKHQAIVFYKEKNPVRLMVLNKNTDIDSCLDIAMKQHFKNRLLRDYYNDKNIKSFCIDLQEKSVFKSTDKNSVEMDVGSCDRWNLLYSMLKGSYTEEEVSIENYQNDTYKFIPKLFIKYELMTDTEKFEIEHTCALMNTNKTRLIIIQENSLLTK